MGKRTRTRARADEGVKAIQSAWTIYKEAGYGQHDAYFESASPKRARCSTRSIRAGLDASAQGLIGAALTVAAPMAAVLKASPRSLR